MPSAGSFRRFAEWSAGDGSDRVIDVGTVSQPNREQPTNLGFVRVGYLGAALLHPLTAVLAVGDNGSILGPIDVPFSLVVEEPVRVTLTPVGLPAALLRIVLSVTPVCCPIGNDFATRTLVALGAAVLVLPQWVRQVSALAPATFQFRDRTGAPLSGVLSGVYQRPPLAYDVQIGVAGAITFGY